jgi:release factor glutamine methyltransferase
MDGPASLEWTSGFFTRKNVDAPRLSAELLLAHVLNYPRIKLYTDYERPLEEKDLTAFASWSSAPASTEPIAYLTGGHTSSTSSSRSPPPS